MVNWYAVGLAAAIVYILPKRYLANKIMELYKTRSIKSKRKTVIVMLDQIGMNFEKARFQASSGSKIIIASRDIKKAEIAKNELMKLSKNRNILTVYANSTDRQSMAEFAQKITENESKIDCLINNEGFDLSDLDLVFKRQELAKERFESHCLNFLYDGEGSKNYKLQGWYPAQKLPI